MMSEFGDVGEFHTKFRLHNMSQSVPGPQAWNPELIEFRRKFLHEELEEFEEGVTEQDHVKMADALIDLVYVAMGTAHLLGYPWHQLWGDVQRANMQKVRSTGDDDERSKRGSEYDVVKPAGWQGPRTKEILFVNGFDFDDETQDKK